MKKYLPLIGISLGAIYGLFWRYLCDLEPSLVFSESIYSVTFFWAVPAGIAVIPLFLNRKEITEKKWKAILYPVFSVLLFFICTVSSGIEDWICIIIISSPFLLMVGIVGWFVSRYLEDADSKKILMIVFLPILTAPIESVFEDREDHYETRNEIYIQASPTEVWNILLEVPEIQSDEYSLGFYNIIGIPRPVRSEIVNVNGETNRLGYFTDDLILNETVVEYDTLKRMSFQVNLSKSQMRDKPTDQHILKSEIFQFGEISYSLDPVGDSTRLTLTCEYSIKSKMNGYANLWANSIISDFEQRLLLSLKKKLEAHS